MKKFDLEKPLYRGLLLLYPFVILFIFLLLFNGNEKLMKVTGIICTIAFVISVLKVFKNDQLR